MDNKFNQIDVKNYIAAINDKRAKKQDFSTEGGDKDLDLIISEIEDSYEEKAPFSKEEKERLKKIREEPREETIPEGMDLDELVALVKEMVAKGEVDAGSVGISKELEAEREKNMMKKTGPEEEINLLEGMIDERELEQANQGLMGKAMLKMKERVGKLKNFKK